jgi:hypothetical protein
MIIIIITLCITGLELFALHMGYDGKILLSVIGILASIAGWQGKKIQHERAAKKCMQGFLEAMEKTTKELKKEPE